MLDRCPTCFQKIQNDLKLVREEGGEGGQQFSKFPENLKSMNIQGGDFQLGKIPKFSRFLILTSSLRTEIIVITVTTTQNVWTRSQ